MQLPRTTHKLREATTHLGNLKVAKTAEDAEFHLAAFLAAVRTVTFALQKDLKNTSGFKEWYEGKRNEMRNDPLCKFFFDKRNRHLHTGDQLVNAVNIIEKGHDSRDWKGRPPGSALRITSHGTYWVMNPNTADEELIPIENIPNRKNPYWFEETPEEHKGEPIRDKSVYGLCNLYLEYLKAICKEAKELIAPSTVP